MRRILYSFLLTLCLATPAGAFPTNGVLDNFTGSDDTTPPNSNWTNTVIYGASSANVRIRSNAVTTETANSEADMYYNPSTYGPNCEAFTTIASVSNLNWVDVACRLVNLGANTTDGYAAEADRDATPDKIHVLRIDNGVGTIIGSSTSVTLGNGDMVGLAISGSQICSWYKAAAGAWTQQECVTDTTYSAAGNIGMTVKASANTTGNIDDFGGGALPASTRPIPPILFQ